MKRKALHKATLAATILLALVVLVVSFKQFTTASTARLVADQKAACTLDPQQFLNTVNQWRAAKGVAPLQYSNQLQAAAQARIGDMQTNQYYSHENPKTGQQQGQLVFKYEPNATMADEVLDAPNTAQAAIADFKNSSDHYNALVNPSYRYLGYVSEYLPEQWAEYDNHGALQLTAGHKVWECIAVGELADK